MSDVAEPVADAAGVVPCDPPCSCGECPPEQASPRFEPALVPGDPLCAENGLPCDDEDACTDNDLCSNGMCVGQAVGCNDGDPCTIDLCDSTFGCEYFTTEGCDDGDPCTIDACSGGVCIYQPVPGGCVPPTPPCLGGEPCDDGDECTISDRCVDGGCKGLPRSCDGALPCLALTCDPAVGCVGVPVDEPCDDGAVCTVNACSAGDCVIIGHVECDDGDPCTVDSCLDVGCVSMPDLAPCDDGDLCTVYDHCVVGGCAGTPIVCDDGEPCTLDGCDPDSGCTMVVQPGSCDDGDPCTLDDACSETGCIGTPGSCDDGNQCTADGCLPTIGCQHVALTAQPCDDGNECSLLDACAGDTCVPVMMLPCDGSLYCWENQCDPIEGCRAVPLAEGAPCVDENACTVAGVCQADECLTVETLECDDGEVCTQNFCDALFGCQSVGNDQSLCDDGDACTNDDRCIGTICAGQAIGCDDGEVCTADGCDPVQGCVHLPVVGPCDDGDPCTGADACFEGACLGGGAPAEGCNGLDDDCDGITDEHCPCEVEQVAVSDTGTFRVPEDMPAVDAWSGHPSWATATEAMPDAIWIWGEPEVSDPESDAVQRFRRHLVLAGDATEIAAALDLAADDTVRVWVNGVLVLDAPAPGETLGVASVDLELRPGPNVLDLEVTSPGQPGADSQSNPAGLIYELRAVYVTTPAGGCY